MNSRILLMSLAFALAGCGSQPVLSYIGPESLKLLDDMNDKVIAVRQSQMFSYAGIDNANKVFRLWSEVWVAGDAAPAIFPAVTADSLYPPAGVLRILIEEPIQAENPKLCRMAMDGSYYTMEMPAFVMKGVFSGIAPNADPKFDAGNATELGSCDSTYSEGAIQKTAKIRFMARLDSASDYKYGQKPIWENGRVFFR